MAKKRTHTPSSEFEKFEKLARQLVNVPKSDIQKREKEEKEKKETKKN